MVTHEPGARQAPAPHPAPSAWQREVRRHQREQVIIRRQVIIGRARGGRSARWQATCRKPHASDIHEGPCVGGDEGQKPGAHCAYARRLRSFPAPGPSRALAAAGATVPGALAASGRGRCHPQRGMAGIGDRDLVAGTRAGSPSGRAAAGAGGCSRHDCAGACRCRGHQRQAPAAAPAPPAAGRVAPAAAADLCRSGTSPVRPDTVRAGPGHAGSGGLCWRFTGLRPADTAIPGGDASGHDELLRFENRQRSPRSRTVTSGILQLARTITGRRIFAGWSSTHREAISAQIVPFCAAPRPVSPLSGRVQPPDPLRGMAVLAGGGPAGKGYVSSGAPLPGIGLWDAPQRAGDHAAPGRRDTADTFRDLVGGRITDRIDASAGEADAHFRAPGSCRARHRSRRDGQWPVRPGRGLVAWSFRFSVQAGNSGRA